MQGPDTIGDEFDEATEEEKADPTAVYADIEDSEVDRSVTITAVDGSRLVLTLQGEDVQIDLRVGGERTSMTVARTPLEEDLRKIGLVHGAEPGA